MPGAEPAVTVVIPVWGERYARLLPRAIASVEAQNVSVDVIVVDNASEEGIPEMGDPRVVRAPGRLSAGAARNLGLAAVESQFVMFLDADDELAAGALASLLEGIAPDPDIAVYAMSLVEADTGARHRTPRRFVAPLARRRSLFALATTVWSLYPIQGNAVMRTAWVRDAGGYADCSGGEDWVLAVSQAFRGRVVVDSRPALVYHADPDSLWRRSRGTSNLLGAARRVRVRVRADAAVPALARAALPLVAMAQTLLIVAARPLYRGLRALVGTLRIKRRRPPRARVH